MHIKKRMTIMTAVLAALTVGIGGAVGIPSIFAIRRTVTSIADAQKKLDDRYALRRYMSKAANDIAEKKKRVAPLADAAIQEDRELSFITAIEAAAAESGVSQKITLETANQREISPWEKEIPVSIIASGSYPELVAFLDAIERMPYLVDITVLDVSVGGSGSGAPAGSSGGVRLEVHGLVYWLGGTAPDFVHGQADAIELPPETDANGKPL